VNDTPGKKHNLYQAIVTLSASELQAIEAWRQAQDIPDQAQALRRLIQFGLLQEIRELYEESQINGLELIQKALEQPDD
jgi:hypothetical protein